MRTATIALLATALAAAAPAAAQGRGGGSGRSSTTTPVTRDGAGTEMTAPRDLPVSPRHGFMGSPGGAPDAEGASRLGPHGESSSRPTYGESAQGRGAGEAYETWKSGDRIRSTSSADVRAARQQQAPDLEWASESRGGAPADPRLQPQTPWGMKSQEGEQKQPKR